jgi:hypothetical protein
LAGPMSLKAMDGDGRAENDGMFLFSVTLQNDA